MNDVPRRSLAELSARYEIETSLQDVFVEGLFDKEVITRASKEHGVLDRIVYTIDSVDVPDNLVLDHGLTLGNKQRVIVLAHKLAHLPKKCAFRCMVDRDLDHWFGPLDATMRLVWTDYCSMELYFYTDNFLRDIIITAAKCQIQKWDYFLSSLTSALRETYILRLADREMALNMTWLSLDRCLSLRGERVEFDAVEYAKRVLLSNRRATDRGVFETVVTRWRKTLDGDPRLSIHGHDFIEVLAWVISKSKGLKEFGSIDAITRILVLLADRASNIVQRLEHSQQSSAVLHSCQ